MTSVGGRPPRQPDIEVLPDAGALCRAAADHVARHAARSIARSGRFVLALSGGSTPRPLFELLAGPEWADRIPWELTHILWTDERCVPPDSPESNFGAAFRLLLSRVTVPEGNIHRMRGELDPQDGARHYETELGTTLEPGQGFDLALLGMGPDGHTASLFPGTRALCEESRRVVANYVPSLERWRLTATYPLLNASRAVIFLVAGSDKAAMVSASVGNAACSQRPPAAGVRPVSGELLWLVDEGAARLLVR